MKRSSGSDQSKRVAAFAAAHLAALTALWLFDGWLLDRGTARAVEAVGPGTAGLFQYAGGHPLTQVAIEALSLPLAIFVAPPWHTADPSSRVLSALLHLINSLLWGFAFASMSARLHRQRGAV